MRGIYCRDSSNNEQVYIFSLNINIINVFNDNILKYGKNVERKRIDGKK